MKKRILTLLGLTSIALVTSVITFSPKKSDEVRADGGVPVNIEGIVEGGHAIYDASYSSNIQDDPGYQDQYNDTFKYANFHLAPTSYRGDSIKVAIIDSGINTSHEDLPTINRNSKCYEWSGTQWLIYEYSTSPSKLVDTYGHGTNVASVIASQINSVGYAGVAPNVELYIYKVTNSNNGYEWGAMQLALSDAVSQGVDIINMSVQAYCNDVVYNGKTYAGNSDNDGYLQTYITSAYNNNIPVVAAAGNYDTDEPSYPASHNHVISVGSLAQNSYNTKATYSNYYGIDLVAPGYFHVATSGDSNSYKTNTGTSFSSPMVTAAIALYKQQNPTATPSQIESALYASCDSIDDGETNWAGHGALNVDKFLRMDAPTNISITNPEDEEITIQQGDTLQIEYDVLPSDFAGEINFVSANDNVSISDTGLLTANEIGEDIVSVESKDYPDVYDSFTVNVVEAEHEDTLEATILGTEFGSSYSDSEKTLSHAEATYGYKDIIKGSSNSIQYKSSLGEIYNKTSLGEICSIKITEASGLSYEGLKVGFGDTAEAAKNATLTQLTTSGVSGGSKPFFYIKNTTSNAKYAGSIIIEYEPVSYTVSFNSNGGSGDMDNSCTLGSTYTAPLCNFTKSGNIFNGWALNSASGTKYNAGDEITGISGDITLYATWTTGSEPTPGPTNEYYKDITATSGTALLRQLHTLMGKTHKTYTSYTDCKDTNKVYSTDPGTTSAYVTDFYSQTNISRSWGSGAVGTWNREHVWCQSLSAGLWGESYGGSDLQHVRPLESTLNSTRNNHPFGVVSTHNNTTAKYTKNTSGNLTSNQGGWLQSGLDIFEPIDASKGDVARILMYVYMHYSNATGGTDGTISGHTGNLQITDIVNTSPRTEQAAWNLLLQWNTLDPVSENERIRNEAAFKLQGNRNPFIDNDKYAAAIWGNTPIQTKTLSSISLSGTHKTSFDVGDTFSYNGLVVTAHYSDNSEATVTPTSVSSPDMSTAGPKTITVSYTEGGVPKSATYTITVSAVPATSILLSQNSATLKIGGQVTLTATFNPTNTTVKTLTWTTNDDSVATVNNGVVTAVAPGTATITATTSNGKTDTCDITVSAPEVSDITIETSPARVRYNSSSPSSNTFSITATLTAEAGATVKWASSNTSVIRVVTGGGASSAAATSTEVTGYFETVGTGTSTITVSAGGVSETCEVKATLPVKSYQAVANTSSVAYTGSNTTVSCTIYEVYTDNSRDAVEDNYNLTTNTSILGTNIASGTYDGNTVMAPITVTNEGSKESITTSEDANKQAEAWAIYFINMTTTTSTCKAKNDELRLQGLRAVWDTLASEYAAMADLSKTAFCSSSASDKIKEALNHYQFIISKYNEDDVWLADFVVDGNGDKPASSSRSLLSTMFSAENSGLTVAVLSIIGIAAIAGFVLYRKRKMY